MCQGGALFARAFHLLIGMASAMLWPHIPFHRHDSYHQRVHHHHDELLARGLKYHGDAVNKDLGGDIDPPVRRARGSRVSGLGLETAFIVPSSLTRRVWCVCVVWCVVGVVGVVGVTGVVSGVWCVWCMCVGGSSLHLGARALPFVPA